MRWSDVECTNSKFTHLYKPWAWYLVLSPDDQAEMSVNPRILWNWTLNRTLSIEHWRFCEDLSAEKRDPHDRAWRENNIQFPACLPEVPTYLYLRAVGLEHLMHCFRARTYYILGSHYSLWKWNVNCISHLVWLDAWFGVRIKRAGNITTMYEALISARFFTLHNQRWNKAHSNRNMGVEGEFEYHRSRATAESRCLYLKLRVIRTIICCISTALLMSKTACNFE